MNRALFLTLALFCIITTTGCFTGLSSSDASVTPVATPSDSTSVKEQEANTSEQMHSFQHLPKSDFD